MNLYYVRWLNGQHTLAWAKDKLDLFEMLDESGDPGSGLIKKVGGRCAFDFTLQPRSDDDGGVSFVFEGGYESMETMQQSCAELPDAAMTSAAEFFKGCFDRLYGSANATEDDLKRAAEALGVTR